MTTDALLLTDTADWLHQNAKYAAPLGDLMPPPQARRDHTEDDQIAIVGRRSVRALAEHFTEIQAAHRPAPGDPRVCITCGYSDGSWPCITYQSVEDLARALRGDQP